MTILEGVPGTIAHRVASSLVEPRLLRLAGSSLGRKPLVNTHAAPVAEVLVSAIVGSFPARRSLGQVHEEAKALCVAHILGRAILGAIPARRSGGFLAILHAQALAVAEILFETNLRLTTAGGQGGEVVCQALSRTVTGVLRRTLFRPLPTRCAIRDKAVIFATSGPIAEVLVDAIGSGVATRHIRIEMVGLTGPEPIAGILGRAL